jgi:hypothetical protein
MRMQSQSVKVGNNRIEKKTKTQKARLPRQSFPVGNVHTQTPFALPIREGEKEGERNPVILFPEGDPKY